MGDTLMSLPIEFQVAREIGTNFSKGFNRARDENSIERILSEAMASGDPAVLQNSIGQILSQVSPERQPLAVQVLQNQLQNLDKSKKENMERQANQGMIGDLEQRRGLPPGSLKPYETDPKFGEQVTRPEKVEGNIKLTQSLDQVEKRYKTRINNLQLPFAKRDAFGGIFLDFEQDEKQRKDVLSKLDKELNVYSNELKRTYEKFGEEVPEDILDQIKDSIRISIDGQQMSLRLNEQIEGFEKKFPAKKYKNKKATDDEGNIFISDGTRWKLVE